MLTPEQISREAAEAAVRVSAPAAVSVGDWMAHSFDNNVARAEADAEEARRCLAPLFLAAVERALREVPVPTPLSAERLAEIAENDKEPYPATHSAQTAHDRRALLADNAHLRRALYDCGQDGTAAVWASGYEAGKAHAVETIHRLVAALPDGAESASAAFHLGRVAAAIMGLGEAARAAEAK